VNPINGAVLAAFALASSDLAVAAAGEQEVRSPRYITLTLDNDFFVGGDSHYTSGIQIAGLVDRQSLPGWMNAAPPLRWSADPEIMIGVGQRMYTPMNKSAVHPDPNDRPYAGWLYLMADVRTRFDTAVDHVSASIGVIGPASLARQTQTNVHHLLHTDPANGWGAQLHNEPAVTVGYERAWPGVLRGAGGRSRWDVTPRWGATLGNVMTYANAGVVARWGVNLPADIPVTHISLGLPRDGYRGSSRTGWYAWLGLDGRAVARNVFLDGNTWKDSPSVDRKPFGYDVQVGLAVAWRQGRIGFTFVRRSEEFKTQKGADRFGQLTLSFPY
jgi:hypothetical protein